MHKNSILVSILRTFSVTFRASDIEILVSITLVLVAGTV